MMRSRSSPNIPRFVSRNLPPTLTHAHDNAGDGNADSNPPSSSRRCPDGGHLATWTNGGETGTRWTRSEPSLLRGGLVGRPRMRTREPVAQLPRGLVGRPAIKRHERRRDAGQPDDVRAPAILRDGGHFDEVRSPPDRFLKAMYSSVHDVSVERGMLGSRAALYAPRDGDQAKRATKVPPHRCAPRFCTSSTVKFFFAHGTSTGSPPFVNSFSTVASDCSLDGQFRAHYP